MDSAGAWSVQRHLADKPEFVTDLYDRFVSLVADCGPFIEVVTKTAITFKGTHRGFAGAKPRTSTLDGFLDLQREVRDARFLRVSPYTKRLFVHQFRISIADQLDGAFAGWVAEAYAVGVGAHRTPGTTR